MSLLTPSESLAFQGFLSSIDPFSESVSSEWSMYAQGIPDDIEIPPIQGREALVKATKDLMSLDDNRWASLHGGGLYESQHQRQHSDSHSVQSSSQQPQQPVRQIQNHRPTSYRNDVFPFLTNKLQQAQTQHPGLHPISISPIPSMTPSPPASASNTSAPPSSTSSVNFSFPTTSAPNGFPSSMSPSTSGASTGVEPSPPPPTPYLSERHSAHTSSSTVSPSVPASTLKRPRLSPPHQLPYPITPSGSATVTRQQSNHQSVSNSSNARAQRLQGQQPSAPQKAALLSPSQKKANHIQSEQKRRANIRRGYEALCETVPALREAIRAEEEEEQAAAAAALAAANDPTQAKTSSKRRRAKKLEVDGEKLDGRAGPRSENVVLAKTIDYINELLVERSALLARYQHARAVLPTGHPATIPLPSSMSELPGIPLWEREWKGGESREGDDNEEEPAEDGLDETSS
ncbi:hypothetical protein AX16_003853 [Volvariella volvacea WC 439]|nr:hypothetical protein AX16_003853 [Volvariella volvacea WC 439]